jgi:hypothetical protein
VFPLVYHLIELALLVPVATATVERVFSAMKIIKTELRNKMTDGWLNDLMVCYIFNKLKRHFKIRKLDKCNCLGLLDLDVTRDIFYFTSLTFFYRFH